MFDLADIRRRLRLLKRQTSSRASGITVDLLSYHGRPVEYAKDILGVELTPEIAGALLALEQPPYKVSVDSGHGVGKTFGAAVATNYWYDTHKECWIITTAPTDRDVKDLLWTEVRLQRSRAKVPIPNDLMPAAPEMKSGPEHVAKGYTARDANSAQGRHRPNMLFIFDEKEGVQAAFWDGLKSMLRPGSGDAALVIGNPLSTTSRAYFEHKSTGIDGQPAWHRVRISALDHPNVRRYLDNQPPLIPGAVTGEQVEAWLADWCDPVPAGDERPTDIRWKGRIYRPGPIGEPRILGLRPSSGTFGIWSEALWQLCLGEPPDIPIDVLPVIGCDVANYGDDYTAFHVRCGAVSLAHQAVNGWDHIRIADRLKELATEWAGWASSRRQPTAAPFKPEEIPVNVEDDATGRAVQTILGRWGMRYTPMNASESPKRLDLYRNLRSEVWFETARKAFEGRVNVSRLDQATRNRLEQQAMAPEWKPTLSGQREVERKDETKEKLGRSPDDVDAMNLAYRDPLGSMVPEWVSQKPVTAARSGRESAATRRGLWGQR